MEEFKKEYGFDYGNDNCMFYLYPCGILKALKLYREEAGRNLDHKAHNTILDGLEALVPPRKQIEVKKKEPISITKKYEDHLPVQINIIVGKEMATQK